jgi:hypothetical protein
VVAGFAELMLVSQELRALMKAEGLMREDGTMHPAVEMFRKFKRTELDYLTAIAEMRRGEAEPEDLVAQLARHVDGETVEPEAPVQEEPPKGDDVP